MKRAYVGVDDKARRVKKMYVGVKAIYNSTYTQGEPLEIGARSMCWGSLKHGNPGFIAVGTKRTNDSYETKIMERSYDGLTWNTDETLPVAGIWEKVVAGNEDFVAICSESNSEPSSYAAYTDSNTSLSWRLVSLPAAQKWNNLFYINGKYVAFADGYSCVAVSSDGYNFEGYENSPALNRKISGAFWDRKKQRAVIVTDSDVMYTSDWINYEIGSSLPVQEAHGVTCINADEGIVVSTNSVSGGFIVSLDRGETWGPVGVGQFPVIKHLCCLNGLFFGYSEDNFEIYSENGVNWYGEAIDYIGSDMVSMRGIVTIAACNDQKKIALQDVGPLEDTTYTVVPYLVSFARKVKKAYIGIGGIARPFWPEWILSYYGTATGLSTARSQMAAATIGDYAIFAGGYTGSIVSTVDAYSKSLTKSSISSLATARSYSAATTIGNYALIGGGDVSGSSGTYTVETYNKSLTRGTCTSLETAISLHAAASNDSYALFGGGYYWYRNTKKKYVRSNTNVVYAYDSSLALTVPTGLSKYPGSLAATNVGDYVLFAGGGVPSIITPGYSNVVDAYDKSLTRTTATNLTSGKEDLAATTVGGYAIFAGGYTHYDSFSDVDAYDRSLTHLTPAKLSQARYNLAATSVADYAIFAGGYSEGTFNTVDAYDTQLTHTTPTVLSAARHSLSAATVGDFALFAGGVSSSYYNTVDVYEATPYGDI